MLRDPRTLRSGKHVTLVLGARREQGLLYRDEFETLASQHANFRYVPVLSRPEGPWSGRMGRVQPHVMKLLGGSRELDVYICGLKAMVNEMRLLLSTAGFSRDRVIYERYD
jgi:CDP-4-dehydro-6-deoxyglucose reductase